jgi:hypothetical protein
MKKSPKLDVSSAVTLLFSLLACVEVLLLFMCTDATRITAFSF